MEKSSVTALLVTALALPVAPFWQLRSHFVLNGLLAAAIAVAAGWVLNLAWAFAIEKTNAKELSQVGGDTLRIAKAFGWVCPLVLVILTWLVLRFVMRSTA